MKKNTKLEIISHTKKAMETGSPENWLLTLFVPNGQVMLLALGTTFLPRN